MRNKILILLLSVLLAGCCSIAPDAAFVKSSKSYHEMVGVALIPLTDSDPTNDPDLSGVNGRALIQAHHTQGLAIKAAEEALAEGEARK